MSRGKRQKPRNASKKKKVRMRYFNEVKAGQPRNTRINCISRCTRIITLSSYNSILYLPVPTMRVRAEILHPREIQIMWSQTCETQTKPHQLQLIKVSLRVSKSNQ